MNDYNYQLLANGIIEQAANDYRKALTGKKVDGLPPEQVIEECEAFFNSERFHKLNGLISPSALMRDVKTQAKYILWRKAHKCTKCRNKKCIHKTGEHWTCYERGELHCIKDDNCGSREKL